MITPYAHMGTHYARVLTQGYSDISVPFVNKPALHVWSSRRITRRTRTTDAIAIKTMTPEMMRLTLLSVQGLMAAALPDYRATMKS